jgi:hypothetical protein
MRAAMVSAVLVVELAQWCVLVMMDVLQLV